MCKQINEKEYNKQLEGVILKNTGLALQFYKNQQWKVTYYTVLLYGAIIGISRYFNIQNGYIKLGLIILSFILCVISCYLLYDLNHSIYRHRGYVTKIYEKNKEQLESYGVPIDQTIDKNTVSLLLFISITLAWGLTILIIAYGNFIK